MTAPRATKTAAARRRWSAQPLLKHLRFPPVTLNGRQARLEFVVGKIHLRLGGIAHGGVYATVLDTVTGYAAYAVAPKGVEVVTMQLNVNMTGAAKLGDRVIATAEPIHVGRRTAVVRGEMRREDGKLLAAGTATLFFIDGEIGANRE
jgi:acyl-CoA thioesterase